ncbi:Transmembrane protein 234 [Penicillium rolfsii]|nr:Transmembrane protein 234 [Penicillium rolfsii]
MDPDASIPGDPAPSVFNYVLSFLLVGVAWGFTTPFIRRAAADFNARQEKQSSSAPAPSDRGRSQTSSQSDSVQNSGEEGQELLPHYEQDAAGDGGVRRRSGSRQREAAATGEEQEEDLDNTPAPAWMQSSSQQGQQQSWLRAKIVSIFWTVVNLLRTPAYSIPLVINLTGSIWFFLLVGKHELSLTVPLANSSAFLFTVLGEWYVERKVIAKETWLGLILVLGGIALCVHSKNQTL